MLKPLLGFALTLTLAAGCSGDDESGGDGGTSAGGSAGSGTGGSAGSTAGAGGSAGSTGGTAGSGGSGGTAGAAGAGGSGGTPPDTSCGTGSMLKVPSAHATVAEALTAASEGDTILIEPGSYSIATLTVNKKKITITSDYCTSKDPADVEAVQLTGKIVFAAGSADDGRLIGVTVLEPDGKDTIQPQATGTQILFNRLIAANDVIALDGQVGPVLIYGNYIKSNGGDDNIDIDGMFDVTIEKNTLDTAAQDGIEMRFHDGISELQTVTIRDNVFKDPTQDAIQFMDGYAADPKLRKIRIERNLMLRAGTAGVGMNHQTDSSQSYLGEPIAEEIVILNNSFIECGAGISGGANVLAANNIFTGIKTRALWKVVGTSQAVKNLFFMNAADQEQSTVDLTDNLTGADPLLAADFTLGTGSPAIDAGQASFSWQGATVAVSPGFEKGAAPDLGALEKQ